MFVDLGTAMGVYIHVLGTAMGVHLDYATQPISTMRPNLSPLCDPTHFHYATQPKLLAPEQRACGASQASEKTGPGFLEHVIGSK